MEGWVATCRHEVLDRTLIWNQHHLINALREFEDHYNTHRPHRALAQGSPLRARPTPIADPHRVAQLDIRRSDRLGGTLHEYRIPPDQHGCTFRHPHRHYNGHRPHQSRQQLPPDSEQPPTPATVTDPQTRRIRRQSVLGGLINEYQRAA
ncbi:integrase core domain-containing protein [Streptomyces sp. NPDC020096]